jgi:hypothetical protein
MYRGEMYQKPKYGQTDAVWIEQGAQQPLEGQVLLYLGSATYKVAISAQGVRVVQEQAMSLRSRGQRG